MNNGVVIFTGNILESKISIVENIINPILDNGIIIPSIGNEMKSIGYDYDSTSANKFKGNANITNTFIQNTYTFMKL